MKTQTAEVKTVNRGWHTKASGALSTDGNGNVRARQEYVVVIGEREMSVHTVRRDADREASRLNSYSFDL